MSTYDEFARARQVHAEWEAAHPEEVERQEHLARKPLRLFVADGPLARGVLAIINTDDRTMVVGPDASRSLIEAAAAASALEYLKGTASGVLEFLPSRDPDVAGVLTWPGGDVVWPGDREVTPDTAEPLAEAAKKSPWGRSVIQGVGPVTRIW